MKAEPDSSQWCPVKRQDRVDTNGINCKFCLIKGSTIFFCYEDGQTLEQATQVVESLPLKSLEPDWTWPGAICGSCPALSRAVQLDSPKRSLPTSITS